MLMKHDIVSVTRIKKRKDGESKESWRECYRCGFVYGVLSISLKTKTCEDFLNNYVMQKTLVKLFKELQFSRKHVGGRGGIVNILKIAIREQITSKLVR